MKSVLIALLVICVMQAVHSDDAIATRPLEPISNYRLPQHRDGFIDMIQNIAKQTIQLAKDAIRVIQSRIEQLVQDIFERLFGIQQIADETLNAIINDIEKLDANNRNGVGTCVESHMDEIKQIVNNGREEISKCIQTAMGEADKISESLYPYMDSIATLIQNITGVVEECSAGSNPITVAICISQHVTDVSNAISGIIFDTQEAVRLASVQISALVQNTRGCVKTSVDSVREEVDKVVIVIKECIANQE